MHPIEQQIRERAYFIWEGEGRVFGRATEHWLRAEGELTAGRRARSQAATAETGLAPSPARRKTATKAVSATAETIPDAEKPAKPTRAAAKAVSTKAAVTKTAATKTKAVKAEGAAEKSATKAVTAKSNTTKGAATKTASAKAPSSRTSASRARVAGTEAAAALH